MSALRGEVFSERSEEETEREEEEEDEMMFGMPFGMSFGMSFGSSRERRKRTPLERLGQRLDAARTVRRRARVAREMIGLGAAGIEELCLRVMTESGEIGEEILQVLVARAGKTVTVLRELDAAKSDRGAARALEELERRRSARARRSPMGSRRDSNSEREARPCLHS